MGTNNSNYRKKIIAEIIVDSLEEIEEQLKKKSFLSCLRDAFSLVIFGNTYYDKEFTNSLKDKDLEKIIKVLTLIDQKDCYGSVTGIPYLIYILKSRSDPYAKFIDSSTKYWDWGDKFNEIELWVLKHNVHRNPYLPSQSTPEELAFKRQQREQKAKIEEADIKRQNEDKKKKIEKASKDIWKAIQRKDSKAIQGLIKSGADLNQINESGKTVKELIKSLNLS